MKIFGYSVEECITFFMLVVVGYFIAKLFSQKYNGFSVGAQTTCDGIKSRTRCRKFHPGRCEWVNNKCTNKNSSVCNDNNDCKSGICHKNPITKLGNCVNKCSDLNPRACRVHPDKCKVENNNCISKKEFGELCKENNECQSGVCHSKDFADPYKCMNCSDVNKLTCEVSPSLDGHGDVCKIDKTTDECTRK